MFHDDDDDEDGVINVTRPRMYYPRINFNLHSTCFRETFRVDIPVVERIERAIGLDLQRNTLRSHALSPREEILITLHFMGNGSQYHVNGQTHGIHKSTICRCVHRVCYLITFRLMALFIRWPSDGRYIDRLFREKAGFPHVKGIVDGTLVYIDAPSVDEPAYVCRNNRHAINVVIVCGPKHEFFFVSAKCPGSFHDSRCLKASNMWRMWDIHGWRPDNDYQGIILGDSAYALRSWLMTPIVRNVNVLPHLRNAIGLYLRSHRRTRFLVECAIGIWKEKFPVLNQFRIRSPVRIANVIYATATLHNMQNFHRRGSYEYDSNLNAIAQRENNDGNIENDFGDAGEEEDENRFNDGANRQLELLEYFNGNV